MQPAISTPTSTSTETLEFLEEHLEGIRKANGYGKHGLPKPLGNGARLKAERTACKWRYSTARENRWLPEFPDLRDRLYEHRCADWIGGHKRALTPPSGWDFVPELVQYHQGRRKGFSEPPRYGPRERAHWDSFKAWFDLLFSDTITLCDTLDQSQLDRDLERRELLGAASAKAKDVYQGWLSSHKAPMIAWLPLNCVRGPNRERCTIVDKLAAAVLRADEAPRDVEPTAERDEQGRWGWLE